MPKISSFPALIDQAQQSPSSEQPFLEGITVNQTRARLQAEIKAGFHQRTLAGAGRFSGERSGVSPHFKPRLNLRQGSSSEVGQQGFFFSFLMRFLLKVWLRAKLDMLSAK